MSADGDAILGLIAREGALADEFISLTAEQAELLEREEMAAFGKSLEKRQLVIDEIQRLRGELQALAGGGLSGGALKAQNAVLERLRQGQARNAENELRLKEMMDKLSSMIKNLKQNQKGLGGYGIKPDGSAEFFDKKL
jgi:flagellin-specific chaperone FliS